MDVSASIIATGVDVSISANAACLDEWEEVSRWSKSAHTKVNPISGRKPKPPMWLIATSKAEEFNYFKSSKIIQRKVGTIERGNISRFGKKSRTQSFMLNNIKIEENLMEDIKPHLNSNYGTGVIYNRGLYDFSKDEILDICPKKIWKAQKIPRATMIIFTFEDRDVHSQIYIENERITVRLYKQKPLQCFNCFKFGHPSRICKNVKICDIISDLEHIPCTNIERCTNCSQDHKPTNRICPQYQIEEAALQKSDAEHISAGHAR
ncbi:uncharacterized protein [Palaemon carinicauda]|uniref:uncharacterized protein n=1 Tax=Palaemon carinicauda TaxID=392227 RepID=UPI0035B642CA